MKTLDEVIKAYEICINEWSCKDCPYTDYNADGRFDCSLCGDCTNDALYYLKELQRFWTESQTNDPLTWDELKQMEGKPVWIELLNHGMWDDPLHRVDSEWWVIGEIRKDDIIVATYLDEMELCEEDIDVSWKAYIKEHQRNDRADNAKKDKTNCNKFL